MSGDDRTRIREALERAAGPSVSSVERLVARVPALLARAARERAAGEGLGARAWRMLPRLAAATAGAVILALAAGLLADGVTAGAGDLDALILGDGDDVLLQAVTGRETAR